MTETRRPLHIGVFVGLSAGAYALSLAGVTALQARQEAAVAADRAPTVQAIRAIAGRNDSLEEDARLARDSYARATGAYDRIGWALGDVEARLGELAGAVELVSGAARALPDRVALPPVTRTVRTIKPPAVHATSGASGG